MSQTRFSKGRWCSLRSEICFRSNVNTRKAEAIMLARGVSRCEAARVAWRFLRPLPLRWRLHQTIRAVLYPAGSLIEYLPEPNVSDNPVVLLDLGCGHGTFLALAKTRRPELDLVGLDLSEEKIDGARRAFAAWSCSARELLVKDIADFGEQSVDAITIVDVMYLVPMERWAGILQSCYRCLRPGGKLLLKEMDRSIGWKFALLNVEETLAVKALGLTLGSTFTFPNCDEVSELMRTAGFEVKEQALDAGYFVPHYLWTGYKARSVAQAMHER